VQSPVALADLQAAVGADLGTFGRTLLLGRRRALGATRTTILTLVLARTLLPALLPALLGAVIGTAAGLWIAGQWAATPPRTFTAGTATLAVLAALASTLPPATYAAGRDPVRVLRTP